jgi:CheY-like chemotaxis protein
MTDTILIVDDEAPTRDLLRIMFKTFGYATEGVGTGAEALAYAAAIRPALVVLDLMLPDMTGHEVCATLRADPATAHIPVAMLTAMHNTETRERAQAVGVSYFLTKPVTRAQIGECLDALLIGQK